MKVLIKSMGNKQNKDTIFKETKRSTTNTIVSQIFNIITGYQVQNQ
jgi:hypothetical protein